MKHISLFGQLLMWSGFLTGSLATVLHTEKEGDRWQTIPWAWYVASLVIGVVGVALIRMGKNRALAANEKTRANFAEIGQSLQRILVNLKDLRAKQDSMPPSQIVAFIDDKLAEDFAVFADGRESIISQNGLQHFADVMTQFAAGERAVNRAWSAAADGYVDEAASCLERGEAFLLNANLLLVGEKKTSG